MEVEVIIFDWQGVLWQKDLNEELIGWMKSSENITFALLTNCRGDFRARLEELEIAYLFEAIKNPNVLGVAKPDLKAFNSVLSELNVETEKTVFVDDSYLNVKAAQKLGIQAIHYKNNDQLFRDLNTLIK